jgi:hypothetical protein
MVNNHPISYLESPATWSCLYNLTAWFVARDNSLITLRTLSEMLVVYAANIGAANSRSFNSKKNLSMPRRWHRQSSELNSTVSR